MKKILLSVSFVYLIAIAAFAQSLSLSDANGPIANESTVVVYGDTNTTIQKYIFVTNNSASNLDVKVKKVHIDILAGTENAICWGQCFNPDIFVSPGAITINAGATDNLNFIGDYIPHDNIGKTTVLYVFFDVANTSDSVCVYVEYNATPVGLENISLKAEMSSAYPNPAINFTNFDYNLAGNQNAQLIIRNMLGAIVKEVEISESNGTLLLNTSDMDKGVYFYSLIADNKLILTRKLAVE